MKEHIQKESVNTLHNFSEKIDLNEDIKRVI